MLMTKLSCIHCRLKALSRPCKFYKKYNTLCVQVLSTQRSLIVMKSGRSIKGIRILYKIVRKQYKKLQEIPFSTNR